MYHSVQQFKPACTAYILRGEIEVARKDPGASQLTDDTGDSLQEVNVPWRKALAKVQVDADKMNAAAADSADPSHDDPRPIHLDGVNARRTRKAKVGARRDRDAGTGAAGSGVERRANG